MSKLGLVSCRLRLRLRLVRLRLRLRPRLDEAEAERWDGLRLSEEAEAEAAAWACQSLRFSPVGHLTAWQRLPAPSVASACLCSSNRREPAGAFFAGLNVAFAFLPIPNMLAGVGGVGATCRWWKPVTATTLAR